MAEQMIITDHGRSVLNCFRTVWYIKDHKIFTERLKSQLSRDLSLSDHSGSWVIIFLLQKRREYWSAHAIFEIQYVKNVKNA